MTNESKLYKKIINRTAKVGVIGVGYVGKALVNSATRRGFSIIGFSRSKEKAKIMSRSRKLNFTATADFSKLADCDVICVCVPTPINEDKSPDLNPLLDAISYIKRYSKKSTLVIIESTVAPGTTRNIVLPVLQSTELDDKEQLFLAFSPERVDPGNKKFRFSNTPKVVGGIDKVSHDLAIAFYEQFVEKVVPVSNPETAEMSKILENTFRLVNISFINQLKEYTDALGIDMWEVVNAAATKPFGFMPHYPGPGVGGHCIPVDPYYLLDDAKKRDISLTMVQSAGDINDQQIVRTVNKTCAILASMKPKKRKGKILVVGVAYKPNIADVRESPILKIMEQIHRSGHTVDYYDPYVTSVNGFTSRKISSTVLAEYDVIILGTDHKIIDYKLLRSINKPILDTRNVYTDISDKLIFRI